MTPHRAPEGRAFFDYQQRRRQAALPVCGAPPGPASDDRPTERPTAIVTVAGDTYRLTPLAPPVLRLVIPGPDEPTVIALYPGEYPIGREEGSRIFLDDPNVSRHHALLRVDAEQVSVEDLGSTNGTTINGEPVEPGDPRRIQAGDRLDVGDVECEVEVGEYL